MYTLVQKKLNLLIDLTKAQRVHSQYNLFQACDLTHIEIGFIVRLLPKALFLISFFLWLSLSSAIAQPFGYGYAKQITLLSSQVSGSNQTNFPVLISLVDNDLRSTANGGRVTSSNGYDIVFTTFDCMTILDHQLESYAPTTGTLVAWVRIPALSNTSNTVIHMYYGNSSVTTNPSTTSVWDSSYKAVWHFNNSTSDNTANGNNMTDNSTTNFPGAKIADGRNLNNFTDVASSVAGQYLSLSNGFFAGITNFSFEGWIFQDRSNTHWERIFDFGQGTTVNFFLSPSEGTGFPAPARARITTNGAANEQGPISGNLSNTAIWIHWGVVLDNATSTMTLYRNGTAVATAGGTVTLTPQNLEPSTANYLGRSQYGADHYIDAHYDEFRMSTTARSAGWITTSFNNQNSPSTFYTVSAESAAAALCSILPVELLSFGAKMVDNDIHLQWTTTTEINNEKFIIERSTNGVQWKPVGTVPGSGSSYEKISYSFVDKSVFKAGRYYYRLVQVDYDGNQSYSDVVVTDRVQNKNVVLYFDGNHNLVVEYLNEGDVDVRLCSVVGQDIALSTNQGNGKLTIDVSGVAPGIYIVRIYSRSGVITERVFIE